MPATALPIIKALLEGAVAQMRELEYSAWVRTLEELGIPDLENNDGEDESQFNLVSIRIGMSRCTESTLTSNMV